MARLQPLQGARALDVGCGTGSTTRALVSAGATEAVGVDLSDRMIRCARAAAEESSVSYRTLDAMDLDAAEGFDRIFSRCGVMFFDDPAAAFSHLRRLCRPQGRLAFAAWQGPFDNPWMSVPMLASIPVLGPPDLPGPGEPGPFSLADPDRVKEMLDGAGWSDVVVEPLTVEAAHPAGDAAAVAHMAVECVPPLAAGAAANPSAIDHLERAIVDALVPYERDGAVVLAASALIVSASR